MFSGVRGLLIDVTGVLYESGTSVPIPGSIEAIRLLRQSNVGFRFVSNESQCSTDAFLAKLHRIGYNELTEKEVFLPAPAAARYVKELGLNPYYIVHPEVACMFEDGQPLKNDGKFDSVLVGDAAEYFTFEKINTAFNILMQTPPGREPTLLTLGYGRYYKHGSCFNLDVGPFVEAIRFGVGYDRVKPIVFGKPSPNYFNAAIADLSLTNADVAMIGDDVNSDVGGAKRCGMRGILVKTGKYSPGDEQDKEHPPDAVVDNLLAAVRLILDDSSS